MCHSRPSRNTHPPHPTHPARPAPTRAPRCNPHRPAKRPAQRILRNAAKVGRFLLIRNTRPRAQMRRIRLAAAFRRRNGVGARRNPPPAVAVRIAVVYKTQSRPDGGGHRRRKIIHGRPENRLALRRIVAGQIAPVGGLPARNRQQNPATAAVCRRKTPARRDALIHYHVGQADAANRRLPRRANSANPRVGKRPLPRRTGASAAVFRRRSGDETGAFRRPDGVDGRRNQPLASVRVAVVYKTQSRAVRRKSRRRKIIHGGPENRRTLRRIRTGQMASVGNRAARKRQRNSATAAAVVRGKNPARILARLRP